MVPKRKGFDEKVSQREAFFLGGGYLILPLDYMAIVMEKKTRNFLLFFFPEAYYKKAEAAVVVIDVTQRKTLDNGVLWKKDVDDKVYLRNSEPIPVILFANKVPLAFT